MMSVSTRIIIRTRLCVVGRGKLELAIAREHEAKPCAPSADRGVNRGCYVARGGGQNRPKNSVNSKVRPLSSFIVSRL